jgi:hypothetical protein
MQRKVTVTRFDSLRSWALQEGDSLFQYPVNEWNPLSFFHQEISSAWTIFLKRSTDVVVGLEIIICEKNPKIAYTLFPLYTEITCQAEQ